MARAKVARELRELDVKIFGREWIAESVKESLQSLCKKRGQQKRWRDSFSMARACFADYELGKGNIADLASSAQYLAHAEVACRVRERYFDPDFRPEPETTEELTRMIELFDPAWRFAPRAICLLNPSFVGSESIGGADADLLTDNLLTDFKTTKRKRIDGLLQLVGYAALARDGGFVCGGQIHSIQIEEVAIYFARFGVLARWRLDRLFACDGWEQFCNVFRKECLALAEEHHEEARNLEALQRRIKRLRSRLKRLRK